MRLHLSPIRISKYGAAAALLIALSASLRLFFIAHNWPQTNSDEGTVGLMALHIAHWKDFPLYLYGQGTLGSLEAYIGALLFPIFGQTVFALRFGLLLLFIPFLIGMYLLTSRLYSRGLALLTLIIVSLGPGELLFRSYAAFAGHAETPLFGVLMLLTATYLALSSSDATNRLSWRRTLGYGLWGYLIGAAFWNDALTLPFAVTSSTFLLVFCREELGRQILFSASLGLLIALLPLVVYTILVPIDKGALSAFGFLAGSDHTITASLFEHFAASFLVSLPVTTGASEVCPMNAGNAWPLSTQSSPQVLQCTAEHGIWALALVVLWLTAVIMAVRYLRLQPVLSATTTHPEKREKAIIQGARLMLLGSALLTFLTFASSIQSISGPWSHHRYLIALVVATPAVLWPLWSAIRSTRFHSLLGVILVKFLCASIVIFFLITIGLGTLRTPQQFPRVEQDWQQHQQLASTLVHLHITHIYTDYWTCNITAFLSREQVVCSVLDEKLEPGFNRYAPYASVVVQDPKAAYVFLEDAPQMKQILQQKAQKRIEGHYNITTVGRYWIYSPIPPNVS